MYNYMKPTESSKDKCKNKYIKDKVSASKYNKVTKANVDQQIQIGDRQRNNNNNQNNIERKSNIKRKETQSNSVINKSKSNIHNNVNMPLKNPQIKARSSSSRNYIETINKENKSKITVDNYEEKMSIYSINKTHCRKLSSLTDNIISNYQKKTINSKPIINYSINQYDNSNNKTNKLHSNNKSQINQEMSSMQPIIYQTKNQTNKFIERNNYSNNDIITTDRSNISNNLINTNDEILYAHHNHINIPIYNNNNYPISQIDKSRYSKSHIKTRNEINKPYDKVNSQIYNDKTSNYSISQTGRLSRSRERIKTNYQVNNAHNNNTISQTNIYRNTFNNYPKQLYNIDFIDKTIDRSPNNNKYIKRNNNLPLVTNGIKCKSDIEGGNIWEENNADKDSSMSTQCNTTERCYVIMDEIKKLEKNMNEISKNVRHNSIINTYCPDTPKININNTPIYQQLSHNNNNYHNTNTYQQTKQYNSSKYYNNIDTISNMDSNIYNNIHTNIHNNNQTNMHNNIHTNMHNNNHTHMDLQNKHYISESINDSKDKTENISNKSEIIYNQSTNNNLSDINNKYQSQNNKLTSTTTNNPNKSQNNDNNPSQNNKLTSTTRTNYLNKSENNCNNSSQNNKLTSTTTTNYPNKSQNNDNNDNNNNVLNIINPKVIDINSESSKSISMSTDEESFNLSSSSFSVGEIKGFVNLQAHCFLNSVIQMLRGCLKFNKLLLQYYDSNEIENSKETDDNIIFVVKFCNLMKKLKSGAELEDELKYIQNFFISSCYSDDVNKCFINLITSIKNVTRKQNKKIKCKNHAESKFKSFQNLNSGFVFECFYGQMSNSIICRLCNKTLLTKYQLFKNLPLPVPKSSDPVSLIRCIEIFFEESAIEIEDPMECQCESGKTMDMVSSTKITHAPYYLFIYMDRGGLEIGSNKKETFIKTDFQIDINTLNGDVTYKLISVIDHLGTNESGHYYCKCSYEKNNWWLLNDTQATKVKKCAINDIVSKNSIVFMFKKQRNRN